MTFHQSLARAGRRLISESAIYGFGRIANQALNFVLVPIYAHVLGISAYGVVAILSTTLALASALGGFALTQSYFRSYLRDADTPTAKRHALGSAYTLRILVTCVFLLVFVGGAVPFTVLTFQSLTLLPAVLLLIPAVAADTINQMPLQYLRAERKPGIFAALTLSRALIAGVLILLFVVLFRMGIMGVALGWALGAVLAATAGTLVMARAGGLLFSWDRQLMMSMLMYSLPLVPATLAGWSLNLSDRYVLNAYTDTLTVGIYSLGYTIGMAINVLLVQPVTLAWAAAKWDVAAEADAPRTYARLLEAFVIVGCALALALSVFAIDLIRMAFPRGSELARYVVPFSAFGYLLYGVYTLSSTGLNITSRTHWLGATMLGSAGVNLLLNLILVPTIGFIGAGVSTVVGYGLLVVVTAAISQQHYFIPWKTFRLVMPMLVAAGLVVAALSGPDLFAWRLGICLAFAPLLVVTGVVPFSVLRFLLSQPAAIRKSWTR